MELTREYPRRGEDLLYPMMLFAAIAVIVFSILGMASMTGWMPRAIIGAESAVPAETTKAIVAATGETNAAPLFQCAECGVIDSVREIERSGSLENAVFPKAPTGYATGI